MGGGGGSVKYFQKLLLCKLYKHSSCPPECWIIFVLLFQRTFREIMFLQEFGDHPNVIKLHNVIKAENDKDIYLVFEFMGMGKASYVSFGSVLNQCGTCIMILTLILY